MQIIQPSDLTRIAPALTFRDNPMPTSSGFAVRGIGTSTFSSTVEQSVSTVVDGVVLGQPQSAAALIDIGRVAELRGVSRKGDGLAIGALTTHAEIASSADVRAGAPALADAAAIVGDPAVRNRGTIGGNIAHADPASDLPAVLVTLGATIHLQSLEGNRSVPAKDFFVDLLTTDLGERDLGLDYDHLDEVWAPLHFELNYRCLNDIAGLQNPTSENISAWLWDRLKPVLPELSWVTVYETGSSGANSTARASASGRR